ncbi:hypothetical protein EII34_10505 [Arachnia propionica]|uniref:Uncharacterized protein n=1 Tax=Arachnia propionica TaxID=1750 RepID=A0A3P1T4M3_9ACTN|nr:hypothetical protein [Arachnia propionica]MDO5083624.1 hypothetical protein [Arachnia propionica]RRD04258.1 hypothetical protein EII34_10505 [Arachnia propionica]
MNLPFLIAGLLLLAACAVHVVAGDREQRQLRPATRDHFGHWLTGRCVFHMASIDLLVQGAVILLLGLEVIPFSWALVAILLVLQVGYLIAWLVTLVASGARREDYARQAQWALFLVVVVLLSVGWAIH